MPTPPNRLPQGTVTFLFTDIEGSTPLLERLGRVHYHEVLKVHRQLLREAVAAGGGAEVRCEGDSLFAVFPSTRSAATAAVAAQRALEANGWPPGARVRVRAGLHTGEATLADGDYVGIAVHRARRVCDAAHGGQVVASSTTGELLRAELPADVRVQVLGEVRLAGFEAPERLFQLERAGEPAALDPALAGGQPGVRRLVVKHGVGGHRQVVRRRRRAGAGR